jgi:DNA-binding transcriptional LysR family regulator
VLGELRKIRDEVSSVSGVASGQVCVGGLAYSRNTLLPKTIERTVSAFPQILVRTIEGPIGSLLSGMHAGEIDFLICAHPDATMLQGVLVEPIVEDPMRLFVSHRHPLAARKKLSPEDVLAYPFIFPPVGSVTRDLLEKMFLKAAGRLPKGMVETSSYTIIRHILLNSPQIAFRSMGEFETERLANLIVPLDLGFELPARSICILQRRGANPTSAVQEVLTVLREEAAGH